MAPTSLGAMSRRGARLGPASHVLTLRPCRRLRALPDTTATLFSLPALILCHFGRSFGGPARRWPRSHLHNHDPAVTGPGLSRGKSSPPRPDRALRAPTQDSDGTHVTRRHVTPWCMARPGFTHTDSASVTAAPQPPLDTTATCLLIELTAAVTLRSTARPIPRPRHSVRARLFAPRPRRDLDGTQATRRHVTPRCAARPGSCMYRLGDRDGGPSTTAGYDYGMTSYRIHGGRDPAALAPARPVVPHPDHNRHARRRIPTASSSLGPTQRRGARLGPALHAQTRRP
jgi:hypothetical protein